MPWQHCSACSLNTLRALHLQQRLKTSTGKRGTDAEFGCRAGDRAALVEQGPILHGVFQPIPPARCASPFGQMEANLRARAKAALRRRKPCPSPGSLPCGISLMKGGSSQIAGKTGCKQEAIACHRESRFYCYVSFS